MNKGIKFANWYATKNESLDDLVELLEVLAQENPLEVANTYFALAKLEDAFGELQKRFVQLSAAGKSSVSAIGN